MYLTLLRCYLYGIYAGKRRSFKDSHSPCKNGITERELLQHIFFLLSLINPTHLHPSRSLLYIQWKKNHLFDLLFATFSIAI